MGFIPEFIRNFFRERRWSRVWNIAYKLKEQKRFAEAAEVYADYANEVAEYNEFLSSLYYRYAFELRIAEKNADKSLELAQIFLRIVSGGDGRHLKSSADDLLGIAGELYGAGFIAAADSFSNEVNAQFIKFNLPVRCLAAPMSRTKFPASCPQCGAQLPYSPHQTTLECGFCGIMIYGEQQ